MRVRMREVGSDRAWHERRALALARSLPGKAPADLLVDTDGRSLSDIADEVASRMTWAAVA